MMDLENINGVISLNLTGGTVPFTYIWSTGEFTSSITATAPGTFSLTVTDNNGCTVEDAIDVSIVDPCQSFTGNVGEQPIGSGMLWATASGGTTPYLYEWSTGETTSSITVTNAGTYTVNITDANGCVYVENIASLGGSLCSSFTASIGEQPPGTGMLWSTVNGGTAPYTYMWSTGETTQNITVNIFGTYSVTIEDANGCLFVTSIDI